MAIEIPHRLCRRVARLHPVKDYLRGTPPLQCALPDNILLFSRKHSRDLEPGAIFHHHRFVLIVNFKGRGRVILDSRVFDFRPGNALLFFPFQFHHYFFPEPLPLCWLFVTFEIASHEHLRPLCDKLLNVDQESLSWIDRMVPDAQKRSRDCRYEALVLLAGLLLNHLLAAGVQAGSQISWEQTENASLLDRVRRYVHENIHRGLEVGEVAKHAAVSASHLRLIYRTATGISLGHYIRELRVRRAMKLLSNSTMNVSEIAYACGYESATAFCRAFRKRTGRSPREYRQRHRWPK